MAYPRGGMAVKDLSFRIAKGEFVFLTGHSGAGKSTILKLISADQRPTHGEVRVSGFSIGELTAREVPKLRRRLGIVFQDFRLLEDRTAEENVAFALEVTGARPDTIPTRVHRVLTQVGLASRARAYPARTLRRRAAAGRRSRGRWSTTRRSSWPTSRPAISTNAPPGASSSCCGTSTPAAPAW